MEETRGTRNAGREAKCKIKRKQCKFAKKEAVRRPFMDRKRNSAHAVVMHHDQYGSQVNKELDYSLAGFLIDDRREQGTVCCRTDADGKA